MNSAVLQKPREQKQARPIWVWQQISSPTSTTTPQTTLAPIGEEGKPGYVSAGVQQVGNVGGEPYWTWYGFNHRVEWCAVFVSWVANELGYIEAGIIPKFVACINGVNWFKDRGLWKDNNYTPKESDIIFFDWEEDGSVDHVGIVIKVENNKIYTVEGNSTDDMCRQLEYNVNSNIIYGYGTPVY